ncbi:MAG: hypothetical protein KDA73_08465 [Rhodobacteraceae bacterium]|nr:hypothetical protein [Paracoccaceae bacterium]
MVVASATTTRDPETGIFSVELAPAILPSELAVIDPGRSDAAGRMLRQLYAKGRAAGLDGVLYDNRDRGHSVLPPDAFPQFSRAVYSRPFVAEGLDYGVAGLIRFPFPVIGNSSTALTRGALARSLGRVALADQGAALRSYELYAANHIYVYPGHRDHQRDFGDRLFANTPLFLLSQGSSGSDQPLLDALALCLAAFRPETRIRLEDAGLIAPTAQMVLRRTMEGVDGPADYLSPIAHPPVFDPARLRPDAIVRLANSLAADSIPPMVRLEVLSDFGALAGRDFLGENQSELLFTTPTAVGRAWRSFAHERRVTLSAANTIDPNGRPLRFHWVTLLGNPADVRISPRDPGGAVADIEFDWPRQVPVQPQIGLSASRFDLAVIADNGVTFSAPATFSVSLPLFQNRDYRQGTDGAWRLRSLDYWVDAEDAYADPTIWPTGDWEDGMIYTAEGRLDGFERRFEDGQVLRLRFGLEGLGRADAAAPQRLHHLALPTESGPLAYVIWTTEGAVQ